MNHIERYQQQDLEQTWSFEIYNKYIGVEWKWHFFPFDDDFTKKNLVWNYTVKNPVRGKSIMEVGSAMGQGFFYLEKLGVDLSDYTGFEVSEMGVNKAKQRFPNANWIHANFTNTKLERRYDYGFEREAIHHMPEPVEQIHKILKHIDITFVTTFVGCIEGKTISDLDNAYYNNFEKGFVYFNVISVSEVVEKALLEGFNHIRIIYWGEHEPIPIDKDGHQYMSPELQASRDIARFTLRMTKEPSLLQPIIYEVIAGKLGGIKLKLISEPVKVIRVKAAVKQMQVEATKNY